MTQPRVNSAALEAVLDAADQLIAIKLALGLPAVSYVLGDDEPVQLETCTHILRTALINDELQERIDAGEFNV
jgi:hypothetical protein